MSLASYLKSEQVKILAGRTKAEVLDELIALLCKCFPSVDRQVLQDAISHRESLMSTGIGQGLAVPHARLAGVIEPMVVVGISKSGVAEYDSLDGAAIHIVLLIVAGKGQHEPYLRLLAASVDLLKDQAVRRELVNCKSADAACAILTQE